MGRVGVAGFSVAETVCDPPSSVPQIACGKLRIPPDEGASGPRPRSRDADGSPPTTVRIPRFQYAERNWNFLAKSRPHSSRTILPGENLHFTMGARVYEMTANHNGQAHEDALHTFGGEPDRRNGCNLAGGKPQAVAQPKDC